MAIPALLAQQMGPATESKLPLTRDIFLQFEPSRTCVFFDDFGE